ncbi:hypothetical protein DESC_100022 [Desulfosarcina cetonica]|nr:hypothetical protein DESC_100022 [Desulfosarcina cetonica]
MRSLYEYPSHFPLSSEKDGRVGPDEVLVCLSVGISGAAGGGVWPPPDVVLPGLIQALQAVLKIFLGDRLFLGQSMCRIGFVWKSQGFGQKVRGLKVRRGAQGETFLAVAAFLGGDFGNEVDFPFGAAVHEGDGVFLFDLVAIAHAQAAEQAEGGLLVEPVAVGAILLGQVEQFEGVGGMGHQQFDDGLAQLVDFRGMGAHDQIRLHREEAGGHEPCPSAGFHLDGAQPASAVGLEFFVMAEGGNVDPGTARRLQNGHGFRCLDVLAIDLQKNFTHIVTFLALIPSCSGTIYGAMLASYSSRKNRNVLRTGL